MEYANRIWDYFVTYVVTVKAEQFILFSHSKLETKVQLLQVDKEYVYKCISIIDCVTTEIRIRLSLRKMLTQKQKQKQKQKQQNRTLHITRHFGLGRRAVYQN